MLLQKRLVCTICVLSLLVHTVNGGRSSGTGERGSAKKDDLTSEHSQSWPGHLEPLGAKSTKRPVPVLDSFPTPKAFFIDHILGSLPVVFRGGAMLSPALKTWTDQNLRLRPEAQTTKVDVEVRKKEDRKQPMQRKTFAEFLQTYQTEDEYMVDTVPSFLRRDVLLPPPLVCDDILSRIEDAVMWFSSGGTKSVLHNDDTDNINCLFSGQKEILFVNYTQYRNQVVLDHPEGSYSSLDVESVDMERYPGMRDVEFYHAKMFPGDCIYIPFKWIHQVNSVGRNVAVNVWWTHSCEKMPSPEICGSTDRHLTLADISLRVEQALDFEEDFMENDPSPYDNFITDLVKEIDGHWTEEEFITFLKNRVPLLNDVTWTEECDQIAHEAFEMLDRRKDDVISQEDLDGIHNLDDVFHFHIEAKLMMLADVGHEQASQRKMREFELEDKKMAGMGKEAHVVIQQVEPMDLSDIDWGTEQEKKATLQTNDIKETAKKAESKNTEL